MIKKVISAIVLAGVLISCGGNSTPEEKKETTTETTTTDISNNPDYKAGLELVANNDCLTCHKVNEKLTGPAYAEVAERYASAADTTILRLAHKIIKGGAGDWGTIPMTPHSNLSEEDAIKMVKYVLLLKK